MSIKPWMTSRELIDAVKRKIAIPINQRTFTEEDILAFSNEEMMISQVPDIMSFHEEFFVTSQDVPLVDGTKRYSIPERALGQKLRDLHYKDTNGNLFEMVRVNAEDKSYWEREFSSNNYFYHYYLEGNDVVLTPQQVTSPTGSLQFSYFLRPNQLVPNERAAISGSFFKIVVINNASIVSGDTITVGDLTFTAVAGAPAALQFQIGASSTETAGNLASAITLNGTYSANNGSPSTSTVSIFYNELNTDFETSNSSAIVISSSVNIRFTEDLPSHIVNGLKIDFLQTKPGHKTLKMSYQLPANSVSTDSIAFPQGVIPENFIIGDYICEEYECIIPQIPPDLHNGLAERVCGRILAAQGDVQGLQMVGAKIGDIKNAEGMLLDNRVEGSPQKLTQRKSLVSWLRMGIRRRI